MTATRASAPGVRLALIQMSCTGDKEANITKAVARIRDAAAAGAQLVCLQELFATPYPCQEEDHNLFGLAEPIPGPAHDRLQAVAAQLEIVLISSLFERRTHGLYHNTVVVFDPDG